jgi:hypothetical protein
MTRRLEITASADSQLQRKYSVNGAAREIDNEGRQWVARAIPDAVRHSGRGFGMETLFLHPFRTRELLSTELDRFMRSSDVDGD